MRRLALVLAIGLLFSCCLLPAHAETAQGWALTIEGDGWAALLKDAAFDPAEWRLTAAPWKDGLCLSLEGPTEGPYGIYLTEDEINIQAIAGQWCVLTSNGQPITPYSVIEHLLGYSPTFLMRDLVIDGERFQSDLFQMLKELAKEPSITLLAGKLEAFLSGEPISLRGLELSIALNAIQHAFYNDVLTPLSSPSGGYRLNELYVTLMADLSAPRYYQLNRLLFPADFLINADVGNDTGHVSLTCGIFEAELNYQFEGHGQSLVFDGCYQASYGEELTFEGIIDAAGLRADYHMAECRGSVILNVLQAVTGAGLSVVHYTKDSYGYESNPMIWTADFLFEDDRMLLSFDRSAQSRMYITLAYQQESYTLSTYTAYASHKSNPNTLVLTSEPHGGFTLTLDTRGDTLSLLFAPSTLTPPSDSLQSHAIDIHQLMSILSGI